MGMKYLLIFKTAPKYDELRQYARKKLDISSMQWNNVSYGSNRNIALDIWVLPKKKLLVGQRKWGYSRFLTQA